jgi:hypothetical protein
MKRRLHRLLVGVRTYPRHSAGRRRWRVAAAAAAALKWWDKKRTRISPEQQREAKVTSLIQWLTGNHESQSGRYDWSRWMVTIQQARTQNRRETRVTRHRKQEEIYLMSAQASLNGILTPITQQVTPRKFTLQNTVHCELVLVRSPFFRLMTPPRAT